VADIFVSYTSGDRDWAFWMGQELERLGHVARVHEWEVSAGGDIAVWMEERHNPWTKISASFVATALTALGRVGGAAALRARYGLAAGSAA